VSQAPPTSQSLNIANRLSVQAAAMPDAIAVVEPLGYDRQGKRRYRHFTFRELDEDSDRIAWGLQRIGVTPGVRLALLVRQGVDFISLAFGLFKAGAVAILIDPGMGRRNMIGCLEEVEPEGFVAIPLAQAIRTLLRRRFRRARFNVTVGRRLFWGGATLAQFRRQPKKGISPISADHPAVRSGKLDLSPFSLPATTRDDPAAIIFTTGSTGPPKGVLYTHGNFDAQVDEIRDFYGIEPGEVDLPGFPLFGLFNCAMGATAVIPDMDPSRPALVDPTKIIEAVRDWNVTQAFGSPAIWNRVGRYCRDHGVRLETVRRVLSAGAPVPVDVLERMKACIHPGGEVHTPYGATESLPVASISATEVLGRTAAETRRGAGVCVGRRFPQIEWKVIRAVDGPIDEVCDAEPLAQGVIGELVVRGPVVTRQYVTGREGSGFKALREEDSGFGVQASSPPAAAGGTELRSSSPNALGKIRDGSSPRSVWHRMGDVGYLDAEGRFWFCGRMAHRVLTAEGPMYTIRCEAIFNQHPDVFRTALVGVGPAGRQTPVIVVEPIAGGMPTTDAEREHFLEEVRRLGQSSPLTERIDHFLLHPAFPVDIRHNAKIFREKLAVWAAEQLPGIQQSVN
jgi:acyl-CoA synthetase (AMP-forming)/AMP-acid ligase II